MELLRSERDGPVAVGGVPQHGEGSPDLRDRNDLDALGWHGVYGHPGGTVPVVEQDLGEQAAEGVAHDDRRPVEFSDDTLVVLHDRGDRQLLDRRGILVQRLYLYLKAGVGRDRKSTRLNSSHAQYLVCRLLLEKKKKHRRVRHLVGQQRCGVLYGLTSQPASIR